MATTTEPKKMYALITRKGTAAAETALCSDCLSQESMTEARHTRGDDVPLAQSFVDCSDNDALECIRCGATAGGR